MTKLLVTLAGAAMVLALWQAPASARACKRVCVKTENGGTVCWDDCSKIPGEPVRGNKNTKQQ